MKLWIICFLLILPVVSADIYINEFYPNPAGKDNLPMPEGEWVELYNDGPNVDLEGYYLVDSANHKVYITDVTTYSTIIDDYIVVYMNGKYGFLNNEGVEIISLYDTEDNLIDSVSYADSHEGLSWSYADNRWIETKITPGTKNYDYQPPEESTIKIEKVYLGSDEEAKFGDIVRFKVNIYKGSTDKYAVYAKLNGISKRTQINLFNKYTNYTVTLPIQIDSNCDEGYDFGDYVLEVEGLDVKHEIIVPVSEINKNLCQYTDKPLAVTVQKKFEYEFNSIPSSIENGQPFVTSVRLKNSYAEQMAIKIWSYVYRGSKCYSGEREGNLKEIVLQPGEERVVELSNVVENVETGEYKLKVVINKNEQKTNQELIETVYVVADKKCPICDCSSNSVVTEMVMSGYDSTVYESTSVDQKKVAPVMLSVVGLLGLFLVKI